MKKKEESRQPRGTKIDREIRKRKQEWNRWNKAHPKPSDEKSKKYSDWTFKYTDFYDRWHEAAEAKKRGYTHFVGGNFVICYKDNQA